MRQTAKWDSAREVERIVRVPWIEIWNALQVQWRRHWYVIVALSAFAAILFLLLLAIQVTTGIDASRFTRDPLATVGNSIYHGSISNLGVLIWSAGGIICFFGYALIRQIFHHGKVPHFVLTAGLVTMMFVLDDLYMLHERVLPSIGIPEKFVYSTYGLVLFGFLHIFRSIILRTDFLFLLLALAGFFLTILFDLVESLYPTSTMYLLEDGAKFFGILTWTAYFAMTVYRYLSPSQSMLTRSGR